MSNKKRVLAAVLWFYAGWYVGDMLASFIGLSSAFGLILGTACAGVIAVDPRRIIWKRALTDRTTLSDRIALSDRTA